MASAKTLTGHAQVIREGYNRDRKIRQVVEKAPGLWAAILGPDTPCGGILPSGANAFALLSSDSRTCAGMITGIDPDNEPRISSVPRTIKPGQVSFTVRTPTPVSLDHFWPKKLKNR